MAVASGRRVEAEGAPGSRGSAGDGRLGHGVRPPRLWLGGERRAVSAGGGGGWAEVGKGRRAGPGKTGRRKGPREGRGAAGRPDFSTAGTLLPRPRTGAPSPAIRATEVRRVARCANQARQPTAFGRGGGAERCPQGHRRRALPSTRRRQHAARIQSPRRLRAETRLAVGDQGAGGMRVPRCAGLRRAPVIDRGTPGPPRSASLRNRAGIPTFGGCHTADILSLVKARRRRQQPPPGAGEGPVRGGVLPDVR